MVTAARKCAKVKVRLLPATRYDVQELAAFLRASDRSESEFTARAVGRWTSTWSVSADLVQALDGEAQTLWWGCDVMGIAGIMPFTHDPKFGAIWFMGTDLADRYPRSMTRACRRFINARLPFFTRVGNIVPRHMPERLRWLKHLGFDFVPEEAQQIYQGHVIFLSQARHGPEG